MRADPVRGALLGVCEELYGVGRGGVLCHEQPYMKGRAQGRLRVEAKEEKGKKKGAESGVDFIFKCCEQLENPVFGYESEYVRVRSRWSASPCLCEMTA